MEVGIRDQALLARERLEEVEERHAVELVQEMADDRCDAAESGGAAARRDARIALRSPCASSRDATRADSARRRARRRRQEGSRRRSRARTDRAAYDARSAEPRATSASRSKKKHEGESDRHESLLEHGMRAACRGTSHASASRVARSEAISSAIRTSETSSPTFRRVRTKGVVSPSSTCCPRTPACRTGSSRRTIWKPSVFEAFDARVVERATPPAILVAPDASTRFGGSQYLDSEVHGRHQTFLADEVIPFVDANLPTIPRREARAVVGRSSGGFGALRLAMDRPDVVAAVGSHAGDADFEITMRPTFFPAAIAIAKAGGLEAFAVSLIENGPGRRASSMRRSCSRPAPPTRPRPSATFPYVELPFIRRRESSITRRSRAGSRTTRSRSSRTASRLSVRCARSTSTPGTRTSTGCSSRHGRLARMLRDEGFDPTHEEFPGGHRGTSHRFEASLRVLVAALDAS